MDFVVFSDDWGRHPSSCEHLFRQLVADHRIIWVNTIGYRSPRLTSYDLKRSFEKIASWVSRAERRRADKEPGNPYIISPVIIPFNRWKVVRRINRFLMNRALKRALALKKFEDYVLVSSHPTVGDYYSDHRDKLKLYYCVDDFTVMPGVDRKTIGRLERELIDRSNMVFFTAEALSSKVEDSGKVHYLPHGVDYEHFAAIEKSADLARFGRPIIGFFGMLSAWVDMELVVTAARRKPEWTFVFIGNNDVDIERYKSIDNVVFYGPVSYEKLPAVAAGFDVGMIPFKVNELTRAVNPLKFLEYVALGLPVVSTELPALERYRNFVYFSHDIDSFVKNIESALTDDSQDLRKARLKLASENSWKSRSTELLEQIARYQEKRTDRS